MHFIFFRSCDAASRLKRRALQSLHNSPPPPISRYLAQDTPRMLGVCTQVHKQRVEHLATFKVAVFCISFNFAFISSLAALVQYVCPLNVIK